MWVRFMTIVCWKAVGTWKMSILIKVTMRRQMFNATGFRYSSIEACREKTGFVDILQCGKVMVAASNSVVYLREIFWRSTLELKFFTKCRQGDECIEENLVYRCDPKAVMELEWVNSGALGWRRILTGLHPVDLIGWMEWIWSYGAFGASIL